MVFVNGIVLDCPLLHPPQRRRLLESILVEIQARVEASGTTFWPE